MAESTGIGEVRPDVVFASTPRESGPLGRAREFLTRDRQVRVLVQPGSQVSTVRRSENPNPNVLVTARGREIAKIAGGAGLALDIMPAGLKPREKDGKIENEANPEKGRWLVEQIIRMETELPYERRYNEVNGPLLDSLYKELRRFVEIACRDRNLENPFKPAEKLPEVEVPPGKELIDVLVEEYKQRVARDNVQASKAPEVPPKPEDFSKTDSLSVLINKYNNTSTKDEKTRTPTAEIDKIEKDLLKYFREAHRKGLLKGADEALNSIYLGYIGGNIPRDQVRVLLRQKTMEAHQAAQAAFRLKMKDPEVARLAGVWEPYLKWARAKFEGLLTGEEERATPEKGEYVFPKVQNEARITETFWQPSRGYPKYYEVTAKTPDQFRTAKESFLRVIKNHSLGYAPDELMQHLLNFRDVLIGGGERLAQEQIGNLPGPEKMTSKFMEELRQEFEAEFFIWGADYNNEHYNKDGYKQYMTAMALHEGPQRWTRLVRSGKGEVGAYTWKLDYDLMVELAYNAQGSRGQLGGYVPAQNYLRTQIWEIIVERGMGVVLKDYDRRDVSISSNPGERLSRAVLLDQMEAHIRRHGNSLQSLSEKDQKYYLRERGYSRVNGERIGLHQSEEAMASLYEGFDKGNTHRNNYIEYVGKRRINPERLPERLKKSVKLGRVQLELDKLREEIREGTRVLETGETLIGKLAELKRIKNEEYIEIYEKTFGESKSNFDIAMQMQGATQEKTVRGGGVYFIDRNTFIQAYKKVRETKDTKKDDSKLSPEERKSKWTREQHIGWILSEIRSDKRSNADTFTDEEQKMYKGLTEEQRKDTVDHMPIHLSIKFAQAAVNWTKIKYADDAEIWKRADLVAMINAKDEKGHYKNPDFRACYRTAMVDIARNRAITAIKYRGFAAKLYDADYFVTGFDPKTKKVDLKPEINPQTKKVDLKPMMLKRPTGEIDPKTGKMNVTGIEPVHLDFNTAVDSYLALHTTHTYWAYQNNNTHTLITKEVFNQARAIRDGKIRPEDADILAGLLLTVDPTLCRVKGFAGSQMTAEGIVFDAAVEDSYMSWIYIRNALKGVFLPEDGNIENMNVGYYTEDWGGDARFSMMMDALVAKMPKRWARRFAAALGKSKTPMHVSDMADNIGRKGVMGAISMMDDSIHKITDQRILGQFGITKFINMVDSASNLWFTLVGGVDPQTGEHKEGVFMKPTNNNDKLGRYWGKMDQAATRIEVENEFLYELKESFGRVDKTLKAIRTMYSDTRNAGGALDLKQVDVFLPDGRLNPNLTENRDTGSSRHIAKMFWDAYVKWLLDTGKGGGVDIYGESAAFYKFLNQPYFYFDGKTKVIDKKRTWADWLFDKMAL